MGVTGSSATGTMSASLPELCSRVRKYAGKTPIAVGFGVNTRQHFLGVGNLADGVVIGSKIISLLQSSSPENAESAIREYCHEISRPRSEGEMKGVPHEIGLSESIENAKVDALSAPTAIISESDTKAYGHTEPTKVSKGQQVP